MTRKNYIAIAEAIATANDKDEVAHNLCAVFKRDNSQFDRERFLKACGVAL